MNCREAGRAIVERSLGTLTAGLENALRAHLGRCPACAAEEAAERLMKRELASLRGEFPHAIDIRRRVLREISRIGPVEREAVPARQIGWAAAAAVACLLGLFGSLPWFWPRLAPLLAELEFLAATFGRSAAALAAPLLTLLALPFKLASVLLGSLGDVSSILSGLEPAAIGAVAVCTIGMAATITLVIGRDFRRRSLPLPENEE